VIVDSLQQAYPGCQVLSSALDTGDNEPASEGPVWRVDTLSGSTNLVREISHLAIAVSCRLNNRVEHAVIVDPILNEEFTVSRGQGARCNNRRIRITESKDLGSSIIATSLPADPEDHGPFTKILDQLIRQGANLRMTGCSVLDMAYLASGRYHAFMAKDLLASETEASSLLIQETGGLTTDLSGGPHHVQSGELLASNPKMLKQLIKLAL
jgi:myo-inositol-1(or 4)-monophosphatase